MKLKPVLLTASLAPTLAALASAQSVDWAQFVREDSRISAPNSLVLGDNQEKDMAWADFDRDGWVDLIIVRKQPFTTTGRHQNVLLILRLCLYSCHPHIAAPPPLPTPPSS